MTGYGRTLMAAGLGGLYFTCYAATAIPPWQLITNPFLGGIVLLLWSAYVFDLARRTALAAAGVAGPACWPMSAARLNPTVRFTLAADLILAGTAVLFFLRYGWRYAAGLRAGGDVPGHRAAAALQRAERVRFRHQPRAGLRAARGLSRRGVGRVHGGRRAGAAVSLKADSS